jgi:hypothetical protein
MDQRTEKLMAFLDASVSVYHAAKNVEDELKKAGYTCLSEAEEWKLVPGGKYYVTRGGSAVMAFRILSDYGMAAEDIATVVTAIGNHDEGTGVPVNAVAAALILADKADVRWTRVRNQDISTFDIHDRVNYSVKKSMLKINEDRTIVKLKLTIDNKFGSVMDYFEIFMERMILCRKAAEKLGMQFKLIINEQQLI